MLEERFRILYFILTGKIYWDYWEKRFKVAKFATEKKDLTNWALEQIQILKMLKEGRGNGGRKEANQFAYSAC